MEDTYGSRVAEELAGRVGRLQAELMCIENFLANLKVRKDVPASVKAGADYYLDCIGQLRKADDL